MYAGKVGRGKVVFENQLLGTYLLIENYNLFFNKHNYEILRDIRIPKTYLYIRV